MTVSLRGWLRRIAPQSLIRLVQARRQDRMAAANGLTIRSTDRAFDVVRGDCVLRIAREHAVYMPDIIEAFDYYYAAVKPYRWRGLNVVDYSSPRYHDVIGFDDFPILFPSFSEPLRTTDQYLGFAGLEPGMTVLDLGAYSGLTSIMFARAVAPHGTVVAMDADVENIRCIQQNINRYQLVSGHEIRLLQGAIWNHDDGIQFSVEGNMGSSAAAFVGHARGALVRVPSYTLSSVAAKFRLSRLDFIKCDVEGAERVIFADAPFFGRFKPRIIIETHIVAGIETTAQCVADLSRHGYGCRRVAQDGVTLPLLECTPPAS